MNTMTVGQRPVLFGAGGETAIHPTIGLLLILSGISMLLLPRKYVVAPLLILSMTIPLGQMLVIGPIHLQVHRLLLIFGFVRLGIEWRALRPTVNNIDRAVVGFAISKLICGTLLWQDTSALISQLGQLYNTLALYWFFRCLLRTPADAERSIRVFALIVAVIAACMTAEQLSGRNVLAMFGGVPQDTATRAGYFRSQGPFRVYLTAGAFGATLIPVFLSIWRRRSWALGLTGVLGSLTIAVTSRTSTAWMACAAVALGVAMWPIRDKMRIVRWATISVLAGLHLVMNAPVWALLARIDVVGHSTGWHRYRIVDNCIRHFFDWWLVGAKDYATWEPGNDDMWDTANQYVAIAETNGLVPLICFLAAVVYCFRLLGRARKAAEPGSRREWELWLIEVGLFSNLIAFLGISYFDQTMVYWYWLLALIVATGSAVAVGERSARTRAVAPRLSIARPAYEIQTS